MSGQVTYVSRPSALAGMVLVMGVTGSGKSRFINTLVQGSVREDSSLHSCTSKCQIVEARLGEEATIAIVDTPGFDDTSKSDAEVLSIITTFLSTQYQLGIPLRGIIYLHRITDQKMQGSALRNFRVFQESCGQQALGNVVLLTTMWDKLASRVEGLDRDQELREDFWSLMETQGSHIASFDGSKAMAEALVTMLVAKDSVVLDVQRELNHERKRLNETSAGRLIMPVVHDQMSKNGRELSDLEARINHLERARDTDQVATFQAVRQRLRDQQRRHQQEIEVLKAKVAEDTEAEIERAKKKSKWQSALQVFSSVTGLAVTVVFNLLPIFGVAL